jgi:transglutaminase-like putative cysteine protease
MSDDRAASAPHLPLAELALAGVTGAAVLGFSRLFSDWDFVWPMLVVAAYSHLVTMILRRRGTGIAMTGLISTAGFVVLATWLWYAESTTYGVPDASTWTTFTSSLQDSWGAFQELTAPVPSQTGFLVAAGLAVFFAVFLADWAAFRLWSPIESIVPALTLFVFCTLLGSERQRMTSAFVFCAASLVYLLVHRVARLETSSGWLTADIERGSRWLFRAGATLAAVAVIGGVVVGPRLPTANDSPVVDWRDGDGGGPSSRVTVSPLVDIRGRLVDQSEIEAFRVESSQPSYWRLTALDTFDGDIWRSGGRYGEAGGDLGAVRPDAVSVVPVEQRFEIDQLGALWLPAAFQPVRIDSTTVDPRYERDSATLIVDTKYPNSDQLTYTVTSEIPAPTPEQLARPAAPVPDEMSRFLELPENFSARASELAREVVETVNADTDYERSLALQDFFRDRGVFAEDGIEWEYVLNETVPDGHGNQAIDVFLASHRGYCEMYAGTYAAMARSLGLPARVGVGFTWGDVDPDNPNLYHVKGKHAHAWPEVWLGEDVGWVAFEPTPGRGAPTMVAYAGVERAQTDEAGAVDESPTSTSTNLPQAPTTTIEPQDPEALARLLAEGRDSSATTGGDDASWPVKLGIVALVLLGAVLVYAAGTLAYVSIRRRRRRDRATEPGAHIALAWEESLEDLELIGAIRRPNETHQEFAERAGSILPERRAHLDDLAALADFVTFAPDGIDPSEVDRADAAAIAISDIVQQRVSKRTVMLHRLDPRNVLRSTSRRPRQQARTSR